MSVASKLVRNSVFSATGRLWTAGTTFVIMPYMLRRMGESSFGVYQMIVCISAYFVFADTGMSTALPKYVSEYAAKEDNEALSDVVNTGIAFYGIIAILGVVISWLLASQYVRVVHTPADLIPDAMIAMRWIIFVTGFNFLVIAFRGILAGVQRIDIINVIEVVISVPIFVATVWALYTGKGLVGMAMVWCAQYTLIGIGIIWYAIRMLPSVRLNPLRASYATFSKLLGFGTRVACPTIACVFQAIAERLLIANFLGLKAVALYTFGQKVVDVWKVTFYPALTSVIPAASHLDAVDAAETVRALYERGTKFFLAVVYPMASWLFVITPVFITAWLGTDGHHGQGHHGYSMLAMRLLLMGAAIQLTAGVASSVARGLGRLTPDLVASPLLVVLELGAGILMGHHWGFTGILYAGVLAFLVNTVTTIELVHRSFGWSTLPALFRIYLPPLAVSVLVGSPLYWFNHIYRVQIIECGSILQRTELWGLVGIETVIFGALYLVLIRLVRYVSPDEMRSLMRAARGLGKLRV